MGTPVDPDPRIISIDIETYGKNTHTLDGHPLPTQAEKPGNLRFNPQRALYLDGPASNRPHKLRSRSDLITSVAITIPRADPRMNPHTPQEDPTCVPSPSSTPGYQNSGRSTALAPSTSVTLSDAISICTSRRAGPTPPTSGSQPHPPTSDPRPSPTRTSRGWPVSPHRPVHPAHTWDAELMAQLEPGTTFIFYPQIPEHSRCLLEWLLYADTHIGMNLQYDYGFLTYVNPAFHAALSFRPLAILDISYLNYLEDPSRPEKSLKDIGPVTGSHWYSPEDADGSHRYASPRDRDHRSYNAQDTHNSLILVANLARRILQCSSTSSPSPSSSASASSSAASRNDIPRGDLAASLGLGSSRDRYSPDSIAFYSDLIATVCNFNRVGVPFDRDALVRLHDRYSRRTRVIARGCLAHYNLALTKEVLGGQTGSEASKAAFLEHLIQEIDRCRQPPSPSEDSSPGASSPTPSSSSSTPSSSTGTAQLSSPTPSSEAPPESQSSTGEPPLEPTPPPSILQHPLLQLTPKKRQVSFNNDNRQLLAVNLPPDHRLQRVLRYIGIHFSEQKLLSSYVYPYLFHKRPDPMTRSSVIVPQVFTPPHYTAPPTA